MTICTNWYTMDNKEGVNLNQVQAISTTSNPDYPAPNAKLGDRVQGNNGSEWIFVQASVTVTAQNLVAISDTFQAYTLTATLIASLQYSYGIAEFQSTLANPGDFFWALLKANGGVAVNAPTAVGQGAVLYLSSTMPGTLASLNNGDAINGINPAAAVAATGTMECLMRDYLYPAVNWTSTSA